MPCCDHWLKYTKINLPEQAKLSVWYTDYIHLVIRHKCCTFHNMTVNVLIQLGSEWKKLKLQVRYSGNGEKLWSYFDIKKTFWAKNNFKNLFWFCWFVVIYICIMPFHSRIILMVYLDFIYNMENNFNKKCWL